jgi:apolipoprotein N-acyltransferase
LAFGEYIPFADTFPIIRNFLPQIGQYAKGPGPTILFDWNGFKMGPQICYESLFPQFSRDLANLGMQFIVNVTNDGWFKESAAAAQHFANAKFRAIELRRPMIRCANSGVSAAVDTTGKAQVLVDAAGSHFTRGSLRVDVAVPKSASFSLYSLIGDWAVTLCGLLAFGWACRSGAGGPLRNDGRRSR